MTTTDTERVATPAERAAADIRRAAIADHLKASTFEVCQLMGWSTDLFATRDTWMGPGAKNLFRDGPRNDGSYVVTMSRMAHVLSSKVGNLRQVANATKGDSNDMSVGLGHDEPTAQERAASAEMAAYLGLTIEPDVPAMIWQEDDHWIYRNDADIPQLDLEVRMVWDDAYEPAIHYKDRHDNRLFLALGPITPSLYQWRILGSGVTSELWERAEGRRPIWWPEGKDWDPEKSARTIPHDWLTPFNRDALVETARLLKAGAKD